MANSNNDWSQCYNNQTFFTPTTSNVTTTTTAATSADSPLSQENRRIAKPTRRRSRASRRTPTTLINTDPTNFRAMVQQFTGGPSALAFGSASSPGFTSSDRDPTTGLSSIGYHQYDNLQNQRAHQYELPQQEIPYMFSSLNHESTIGYPNAVVSGGYMTTDGIIDGGGGGGRDNVPSSER